MHLRHNVSEELQSRPYCSAIRSVHALDTLSMIVPLPPKHRMGIDSVPMFAPSMRPPEADTVATSPLSPEVKTSLPSSSAKSRANSTLRTSMSGPSGFIGGVGVGE